MLDRKEISVRPVLVPFLLMSLLMSSCSNPNEPTSPQWHPVAQLPGNVYYDEILFTDSRNGWVIGDSATILHTTDSGTNWQAVNSGSNDDFHSIAFVNNETGWIGGRKNIILHTTDAGISWVVQNVVADTLHRILSMCFVDPQTGWAVSNFGEILHTTDAGSLWSYQQSGTQWGLTSVYFLNATHGWAVATNQIVCRTSDGGAHWGTVDFSTMHSPGWCTDITFIDDQRGWIATTVSLSSSIQTGSPMFYTEDGGVTWTQQAVLPTTDLLSISAVFPASAWVAGFNQIFHTSDYGNTWRSQYRDDGKIYVCLSFTDASHGWALEFTGTVLRYEL